MHLTRTCDYLCQANNIHKFPNLIYLCPHACYLTPLMPGSLVPNMEILRTVVYKSAYISKNPSVVVFLILK